MNFHLFRAKNAVNLMNLREKNTISFEVYAGEWAIAKLCEIICTRGTLRIGITFIN